MKCNGCGGEFAYLGAVFGYGDITYLSPVGFDTEHLRTLCPRCHIVMKDILLRSDLSDHWDDYYWEGMDAAYTEPYNDD